MADQPTLHALPDEDREALKSALLQLQSDGEKPYIPLNVDIDGDGKPDAWTLGEDGEVTLVPAVPLEETAYVSDGDDIATGD